jgi:hypothetical protein
VLGYLLIDGDVLYWLELFLRKVVGFSPNFGFPKIKSCVYCAWLSFYDFVVSAANFWLRFSMCNYSMITVT